MPDIASLLLAAIVGGTIGFGRKAHGQAAVFRTYIIVGVGSCLMLLLSLDIALSHRKTYTVLTVQFLETAALPEKIKEIVLGDPSAFTDHASLPFFCHF